MESILVQPVTRSRILHPWQTLTFVNFLNNMFCNRSLMLQSSNNWKIRRESLHHWKNGHYVFINPSKKFNWMTFLIKMMTPNSIRIELQGTYHPTLKSQTRTSLLKRILTVVQKTTTPYLWIWILPWKDKKDYQTMTWQWQWTLQLMILAYLGQTHEVLRTDLRAKHQS